MIKGLQKHVQISDISPTVLKNTYLRGLESLFVDPDGTPWPDEWYYWWLSKGVERVEEVANVRVIPKKYVEFHDYILTDYVNFAYIELFNPPVMAVTKVQAIYPTTGGATVGAYSDTAAENSNVIFDFPLEWVRLYEGGKMHLVPTQGTLSQVLLGRGGAYLPMIYGSLNYLPQLWRIEYIGGFMNQTIPFIVVDAIYKAACIEALTVLSDTLRPPGVTSLASAVDGISRNFNFEIGNQKVSALFSSRLGSYTKDLYGSDEGGRDDMIRGGMLLTIKQRYQGISMAVG
tara:strand:+ start:328 stop:1191 length:864 start_codon:yes stop_codon:yes gene_type:complete